MRLTPAIGFVIFLTSQASAQAPQLDRARELLSTGNAVAALDILETLPQTPAVLIGRAQAHMMIAAQSPPATRCDHLRRAIDFASMSSSGELVESARKSWRDDGCQVQKPAL
jgi:hypothetical protein